MSRSRPREGRPSSLEYLETVSGSPLRWRVLDVLSAGARDLRDLSQDTNAPRTTLRYNIDRLSERGLVEKPRGEYRLTRRGRSVLSGIERYRELVDTWTRLEPFFECAAFERAALEGDPEIGWFTDATVTVSEPTNPYAPRRRLFQAFRRRETVRGYLPSPTIIPTKEDETTRSNVALDLVFGSVPDGFDPANTTGSEGEIRFWIAKTDVTYGGLLLEGEYALLLGVDEYGRAHATVETGREEVLAWIEETYREHRERAREIGDE